MKLEFTGKRALVTGGTSELALSTAELIINSGVYPVLTCRDKLGRKKIEEKLIEYKGSFGIEHLDFSDPGSIDSLFENNKGGFHYLIDFAQSDFEKLIASAEKEEIYRYFEVNVSFRAVLIKRAAREMLKGKYGRLIFISSTSAERSNPGQGFYAAAKLASEALYRGIGIEMSMKGITALTLRTAYVDAGRGRKYIEENRDKVIEGMPSGRVLTCREVAETVLFFMSDSASGFNAAEINLDCGFSRAK